MGIELPRINLPSKHIDGLASKHKVSKQTVWNAIRYVTDSQLAKDIRQSAKDILMKEAKNVKI
ncbi:MAG: ATP-dependent Lon protease [Flavobacteriales bacterium]|nr:ATP-dependent Lon protease [Flavobacteriales bacterium]